MGKTMTGNSAGAVLSWADMQTAALITAIGTVMVPIIVTLLKRRSMTSDAVRKLYADMRANERVVDERDAAMTRADELQRMLTESRIESEGKTRRIDHLEELLWNQRNGRPGV